MGAGFAEYLLDIPARTRWGYDHALTQEFGFVLSGRIEISHEGETHSLSPGGFFFLPEMDQYELRSAEPSRVLLVRKRYEKTGLCKEPQSQALFGDASKVSSDSFMGNEHARLQCLIPDDIAYDFAMNIFTFDPGHGLPYVETHVMEHGLLVLQGKGLYYLDGDWMEVEKDDFIWMGPYCPQSYYATGPEPTRYIYYKNVNREIQL
jgi:(S)-ureidoglycine aminohydrolase